VSPARAAAWRALVRLRTNGRRFDDSLAAFPELDGLDDRDRSLANEIVVGTLKRQGTLDAVLGLFTKAPLESADAQTLEALRSAAFQLLFLDRVPAYAVVDDAVDLVAGKGRRAQGFVNAVLRRVAEEGRVRLAALGEGDDARAWSIRHSCPRWLISVLRRDLGDDAAGRYLDAANAAPERCLRVNSLKGEASGVREALAAAGFTTRGVSGLPEALLYAGPSLERSLPFRDGLVTPQSRGSQVTGLVVASAVRPLSSILDLCAAPGTKTAQIAATVADPRITAVDIDERRVAAMRDNLRRLGATRIETVQADVLGLATAGGDVYGSRFDAVLLDAPCSGLGTLASRPDVRWRRRPRDLGRLSDLQRDLLASAARCVRPGGTLTYAVCTVSHVETVDVVDAMLSAGGWSTDDLGAVWPALAHPVAGRYLLVLPPEHGSSGFFIARLRRERATTG
jgi:16S rRNA (cytosine967-C5)-methyltransferase